MRNDLEAEKNVAASGSRSHETSGLTGNTPELSRIRLRFTALGVARLHHYLAALLLVALTGCQSDNELVQQIERVRAGHAHEIIVRDLPVSDADLPELFALGELQVLEIYQANISNAALPGIANLQQLRRLRIERAAVDDEGLRAMCQLKRLEVLNLPDADFSDAGLAELAKLPRLGLLRFGSPRVTDLGMDFVAHMPKLRFLHLLDVPITDRGLEALHGMQQLESFYLDGGSTSEQGLRDLLQALPNLHFHKDQLHLDGDPKAGHE